MSALDNIVADHLAYPWVHNVHPEPAPGAELVEAVQTEAEAIFGFRPTAAQISAAALALPGVTKRRSFSGNLYSGMTVETRAARAQREATSLYRPLADQYGPFVRWRPGEPEPPKPHDPRCCTTPERHARADAQFVEFAARAGGSVEAFRDALLAAPDADPEPDDQPSEDESDQW